MQTVVFAAFSPCIEIFLIPVLGATQNFFVNSMLCCLFPQSQINGDTWVIYNLLLILICWNEQFCAYAFLYFWQCVYGIAS